MSMVINLVEDHNIYLCEGGPVYNGGVQPTPITYLTQWRMMGNSVVHTDEYLTQWKVEGNSVVDNNTILSCGDYSDVDGKYHVKISNGVTIYDIPLTEPLRKVNDVADTIEFANGTAVVTRNIASVANIANIEWKAVPIYQSVDMRWKGTIISGIKTVDNNSKANITNALYSTVTATNTYEGTTGVGIDNSGYIFITDSNYVTANDKDAFLAHIQGSELIYKLETPTTEVIQVSPFPISPTDTYTSVNDTPYSAFEYKKNVEIWSCGEYSAVDGKYHILVQPLGGSVTDIALTEPLRKTDNTADTLEYPTETSGKALLTIRVEESGGELSPLDTPTTELVDAPQIEEADSYSCVISQGGKAVEWSSFETE